jgi:hypothetical protein
VFGGHSRTLAQPIVVRFDCPCGNVQLVHSRWPQTVAIGTAMLKDVAREAPQPERRRSDDWASSGACCDRHARNHCRASRARHQELRLQRVLHWPRQGRGQRHKSFCERDRHRPRQHHRNGARLPAQHAVSLPAKGVSSSEAGLYSRAGTARSSWLLAEHRRALAAPMRTTSHSQAAPKSQAAPRPSPALVERSRSQAPTVDRAAQ